MGNEYRYEFDALGHVRCQTNEVWEPTARMSLDGVRTTTWLGPFGASARDLLRVMAAVLEADRLSPRRPTVGKRLARDLAWQRTLELRVAVQSPERWTAAAPQLEALLSFMTDDTWHFEFSEIAGPSVGEQLLLFGRTETFAEVALFSGGLDSVAGLFARAQTSGASFLAVSACGNDVRGSAQKLALETLRARGVKASWLKLDHQLRGARRSRSRMELSQRSRGLLFLAMGAAAACQLGLPTFSVYETGVGCINLPTSAAQVGAQGTRAMHPRTLALFNQLVASVLDRPVRGVAPFFLQTKGELCRFAGRDLAKLASVSMSCDEGEGHKPDGMLHCGLCTSCLFRRIALHSAGLVPDPTHYRDTATRRHGEYESRIFEAHAATLRACRTFDDLVQLDPDARFARTLPLADARTTDDAGPEVLAMYQRYAVELQSFFASARPKIHDRQPQPRKDQERDLFSATG